MSAASDQDWKKFKYGINPSQQAFHKGALHAAALDGEPLSLNAFMDAQLGLSILQGLSNGQRGIVYVKHKMPIIAASGVDEGTASSSFLDACKRGGNVEFGCAVASFAMGAESFPLLEAVRMHTIAAPDFSSDFIERLRAEPTQTVNRGLSPVTTNSLGFATGSELNFSDGSVVSYQDAALDPDPELAKAISNSCWTGSSGVRFGLSVLKHARTIAVVVMHDGVIALTRCGFYDGLEALQHTLNLAHNAGIPLSRAMVLTDGCFGVRSPVTLLAERGVANFVFCGGKGNDATVLSDLDRAGIGSLCTKTRYFFY